jgi:glucosamine kinase
MSAFYAGVDGGQSSTDAVVADAVRVLGRGHGPPADLVGEVRTSGRQAAAVGAALADALAAAGLPTRTRFAALVAGISGYDPGDAQPPELGAWSGRARVVHDAEIAHAGALGGAGGIVVIAGTGSVALGCDAPGAPFVRAGGWGYFFGDEGSALWIARVALRRAMLRADCGMETAFAAEACAALGVGSLRALQHAFAHGEIARPALAGVARTVLALARAGDVDARAVRTAAAAELADLVATVDRRLTPVSLRLVSYAGGLFDDPEFLDAFERAVLDVVPHADLCAPVGDPVDGALVLARRLA